MQHSFVHVYSHVSNKILTPIEALPAFRALIGLLPRVDSLVAKEVGAPIETLPTL